MDLSPDAERGTDLANESRAEVASVRRILTRAGLRRALPFLALGALLILAIVVAGRELDEHLGAIEAWIARLGPWGVLAFAPLFVLTTSALVPDTLLCILAGAVFGMAWGSAAIVGSSLLASALQFALARRLLRAWIEEKVLARPSLAAIQRAVVHEGFHLQLLLRLTPLNPATVSYLLGATGVRFRGFIVACLALAPNLIVGVYFGHAGKRMVRLAGGGQPVDRVHDLALLGGAVVCVVVMVLVARMARRAVTQAVAEPEIVTAGTHSPPPGS